MEEIYQIIEQKIKESGYLGNIEGFEIYNEISDFIEDKDNGTYIFLSKKDTNLIFEYKVEVMNDNFNLSYITITNDGETYNIDFDV